MLAPASGPWLLYFILEALPGRHFMVVLRRRRRVRVRLVQILLGRPFQRGSQVAPRALGRRVVLRGRSWRGRRRFVAAAAPQAAARSAPVQLAAFFTAVGAAAGSGKRRRRRVRRAAPPPARRPGDDRRPPARSPTTTTSRRPVRVARRAAAPAAPAAASTAALDAGRIDGKARRGGLSGSSAAGPPGTRE